MINETKFVGWKIVAVLGLFALSAAHASYIVNFSNMTPGTQLTDQYAGQGLIISTESNGESGPAAIGTDYSGGLANSTSGGYPTEERLNFNFTSPVTLDAFFFNNFGDNSLQDGPSYFVAYDSANNWLDSGLLNTVKGSSVALNVANVSLLQIDNGTTNLSHNWEFIVGSISYTAVPEPTTLVLAGLSGLGMLAFRRFRRGA